MAITLDETEWAWLWERRAAPRCAKPITISWLPWEQHFPSADHEQRMGDPRKLQNAVWDYTSLVSEPWCQGCNVILQPSAVQGRYPSGSWTPLTLLIMAAACHHGIWSTRGMWQKCKWHKKALELWRPSPLLYCLLLSTKMGSHYSLHIIQASIAVPRL